MPLEQELAISDSAETSASRTNRCAIEAKLPGIRRKLGDAPENIGNLDKNLRQSLRLVEL